jgi:hypothetical protein
MVNSAISQAQRKAAKIAAVSQLLSFGLVVAANFAVLQRLIVADPAQTVRNVLAHETLFRVGVAGFVFYTLGVFVLSAALYVILRPVDPTLALVAMFGRLTHGITWLVVSLNLFAALRLMSAPGMAGAFSPDQVNALARSSLSGFDQYYVGLLFWSVGATVGAYVWRKSGYIPRALATFGILASAWCAACTLALFTWPEFPKFVNLWAFDVPMVLFEFVVSVLLLRRSMWRDRPIEAA